MPLHSTLLAVLLDYLYHGQRLQLHLHALDKRLHLVVHDSPCLLGLECRIVGVGYWRPEVPVGLLENDEQELR